MANDTEIPVAPHRPQLFNNTDTLTRTTAVRKREIMESNTKADGIKLLEYEQRRPKILASSEPVEGIFYIYRNQIIPDYKTEILESESLVFPAFNDDDFHSEMYHIYFYHNYMQKKFLPLKNIPPAGKHYSYVSRVYLPGLLHHQVITYA